MNAPKVFVSHASEDKERFVMDFATKLRHKGIDAWIDKWEIKVGDSLVKKIFEEGLTKSEAIIIILSKNSVDKPWVREELDYSVVRKINEGTRIIPIVIDECEVPPALRSTKWLKVNNLNSYEDTIAEIISTIFGFNDKPPIGKPPVYISELANNSGVGKYNNIDSLVTKLICVAALDGKSQFISEKAFIKDGELVLPKEQLRDSLDYLDECGVVKLIKDLSGTIHSIEITTTGFDTYAKEYIEGYDLIKRDVVSLIVNDSAHDNIQIASSLGENQFLVNHILRILANRGSIKVVWSLGGEGFITNISPSLKRSLS